MDTIKSNKNNNYIIFTITLFLFISIIVVFLYYLHLKKKSYQNQLPQPLSTQEILDNTKLLGSFPIESKAESDVYLMKCIINNIQNIVNNPIEITPGFQSLMLGTCHYLDANQIPQFKDISLVTYIPDKKLILIGDHELASVDPNQANPDAWLNMLEREKNVSGNGETLTIGLNHTSNSTKRDNRFSLNWEPLFQSIYTQKQIESFTQTGNPDDLQNDILIPITINGNHRD